jgi:hypothetical protein
MRIVFVFPVAIALLSPLEASAATAMATMGVGLTIVPSCAANGNPHCGAVAPIAASRRQTSGAPSHQTVRPPTASAPGVATTTY